MDTPLSKHGLNQLQMLRLYRRTFADLHKQVEGTPTFSGLISATLVEQLKLEMEDASSHIGVPWPKWPASGFPTVNGQYYKSQIADFIARLVSRLDEALAAHSSDGTPLSASIRSQLAKLPSFDPPVSAFIDEALVCFDMGCFRAAIVLSWCGAVAVLQDYIVLHHLAAFNREATRRDPKWKPALTPEELGRLKEFDLLQVLEAIGVVTKSVRLELEGCLKLRNSCGHPTTLRVSYSRVGAHIEMLLLNVFAPFASAA